MCSVRVRPASYRGTKPRHTPFLSDNYIKSPAALAPKPAAMWSACALVTASCLSASQVSKSLLSRGTGPTPRSTIGSGNRCSGVRLKNRKTTPFNHLFKQLSLRDTRTNPPTSKLAVRTSSRRVCDVRLTGALKSVCSVRARPASHRGTKPRHTHTPFLSDNHDNSPGALVTKPAGMWSAGALVTASCALASQRRKLRRALLSRGTGPMLHHQFRRPVVWSTTGKPKNESPLPTSQTVLLQ